MVRHHDHFCSLFCGHVNKSTNLNERLAKTRTLRILVVHVRTFYLPLVSYARIIGIRLASFRCRWLFNKRHCYQKGYLDAFLNDCDLPYCSFKIALTIGKSFWRSGCSLALPLLSARTSFSFVPYSLASHSARISIPSVSMSSISSSLDDVRAQKQELRKEIRSRMKNVTTDDIAAQSALVWQRLFALPEYQQAKSVGLFLSMPKHEINTDLALSDAIANGKTVYVPQVGKNFELADMDLIRVMLPENIDEEIFHQQWPRNKWGIPEPPESMQRITANVGDIDLLVVPGLAFDAKGGRLGQGKGYYDRFIARMRNGSEKPKLVAVGLEPQFVRDATIPVTELDYTMDMIVLPNQTITVR